MTYRDRLASRCERRTQRLGEPDVARDEFILRFGTVDAREMENKVSGNERRVKLLPRRTACHTHDVIVTCFA